MTNDKEAFEDKVHELLSLDRLGLPLSEELLGEVRSAGAMKMLRSQQEKEDAEEAGEVADIYDGRQHLWLYETPKNRGSEPNYYDRIPPEWKKEWKNKTITKDDWLPEGAPEESPEELVRFVLSSNPRFDKIVPYKKFWLYCEQAFRWRSENRRIEDCKTEAAQEAFAMEEFDRVQQNKLYGLDRYATIKDEAIPGGRRTYRASAPQALLAFLKDCRYSFVLMKGRQAAITSTLMAAAVLTALVTASYKGGLVVDKEKTGLGIFNDKFKNTYQFLPDWWKPEKDGLWSNKMALFDFDSDSRKSEKRRFTSELSTYPASDPQTINSTTMTETYFDEAQKMDNLEFILSELMPTQLAQGEDYMMHVVRSAYVWGTGGSGNMGDSALEAHFNGVLSQMEKGEPTKGWFAIFFDAFCRPSMDERTYRDEYSKYMRKKDGDVKGMTMEQKQAVFSAHYPMSPADCFMSGDRSVVPAIIIKRQRDRIIATPYELRGEKGRYEEIYDKTQPMPAGSFLPYKLAGCRWVKAHPDEYDVPVTRFRPPNNEYTGRYFQGTDPIQSDSGLSRMGGAIWDGAGRIQVVGKTKIFIPTVAAIVNHRTNRPKDTFMQSIMMGMDYRNYGQRKCMELVEVEQGHNYLSFQNEPFIDTQDSLILRGLLPPSFNGGQHTYGISMKKERKSRAHLELIQLVYDHGHNIWFIEFWNQLSTIQTKERKDGSMEWGVEDVRKANDDLVDGVLFAYMAWKAMNETPAIVGSADAPLTERRMVQRRAADNSLYYVEEEVELAYA